MKNEKAEMYVVKFYPSSNRAYFSHYGKENVVFGGGRIKQAEARRLIDALDLVYPRNFFLYVGRKGRSLYKVGIAADVEKRSQELGIEILGVDRFFNKKTALRFERKVQTLYKLQGKHVRRELFKLTAADVKWLATLHKYEQWDNESSLDDMIEEIKRKLKP